MPWHLDFLPRAERDLERLPPRSRQQIGRALQRLIDNPGTSDLKKLAGTGSRWRLRVGELRVLLEWDNSSGVVTVLRVLPRDQAYRDR